MSISRRKGGMRKKHHVRDRLKPLALARCSTCGSKARIEESHLGRRHKVCGNQRQRRRITVPGYDYDYEGKQIPRYTKEKVFIPILRSQTIGDRSKHGVWEEAA